MSTAAFAVPFAGRCVSPQPEPRPVRFEVGARVVFLDDRDEGYVTGLIPGQAVAIRWGNAGRIEVYSMFSGAMDRIAVLETERGGDWL
jgi:hypothetical protein